MSDGYRGGEDNERDEALARYMKHAGSFDRIAKVPEDLREALNAAREIAFVEGWRAAEESKRLVGVRVNTIAGALAGAARRDATLGTPIPVADNPTERIEPHQPPMKRPLPQQVNGFTRPDSNAVRREANIGWLKPGEIGYCQANALMELIDAEQNPQGKLWVDTRFPVRPEREEDFVLQITRAQQHFLVAGPKELHRLVRDEPPPRESRVVMPAEWRRDQ